MTEPARTMPSRAEFDEEAYLHLYPDIARGVAAGAIESGWQHFSRHGFTEGRQWAVRPDPFVGVSREIAPRDEMFTGNETHYFDVGESALHCIESALFTARRGKSGIRDILDLPCGHGRVLRFLKKAFPQARVTACDLNTDGVDYCARVFGATPVHSKEEIAAIPLTGEFDLIWSGSLLTHLAEEKCAAFLQLFERRLRPGGILVFTMHGRFQEQDFVAGKDRHSLAPGQVSALVAGYREHGFAYVDYASQAGYGFSLAQPAFVLNRFIQPSGWRLIGYHENGWDKRQDVICLQKPLG